MPQRREPRSLPRRGSSSPLPPHGAPVWIVGHRGIPTRRPENTLAGFDLAIQLGADAIELDVHATRDRIVVVHHDATLPDGRAIVGHDHRELLPAGTARERLPTLDDVLSLVGDRAAVFVEIKGRDIEPLVVAAVERSTARCAIHAFDHLAVRRVSRLAPSLATGILLSSRLVDTVSAMRGAAATTLWQEATFVDEALVEEVRAAGGSLVAWTVNDPAELRRLARLGVSAVCTDDVAMARAVLRES